jgi:pimeloyl-ACP methyl ester carboxylesterase
MRVSPTRPGTYIGDICLLVKTLGIERLHYVGTSMGALIGMFLGASRAKLPFS